MIKNNNNNSADSVPNIGTKQKNVKKTGCIQTSKTLLACLHEQHLIGWKKGYISLFT